MVQITFKAKPWSTGGSKVVTVPSQYIQDGYIDSEKEYKITFEETDGQESH